MRLLHRPGFPLGLFGLLAGGAMFLGATRIPAGFGYDAVGPATLPKIIALGMMVSGGLCLLQMRRPAAYDDVIALGRLSPVIVISMGLLAAAGFMKLLGWVPMAALVFLSGAVAFGNRRWLRDLAIGLLAALVMLVVFSWGLGIRLPLGALAPVFDLLN
jgi:putative tricarboxylic transport membrane protein